MYKILRYLLPLGILALAALVFWWLVATRPDPKRRAFHAPPPVVQTEALQPRSYQVVLHSQGTVRARTESNLAAEVRGRILSVSTSFQEGGFFERGDVLLTIDPSDYQTELVTAEAALAQSQLQLDEEKARFDQAKQDWDRLNPGEEASPLALREPQLRQAESAVASARARVESAKRNLDRTEVRAPYAGRILTKNVDVGQYVTAGTTMARIYAVDYAEVRLPLSESQLGFLELHEAYRGESVNAPDGPAVVLRGTVGGRVYEWNGRVVRAEGSVDTRTRQLSVVAQIPNPYGKTDDERPPLKIGSFVEASITGSELSDVYVLPRRVLRENRFVLIVDGDGRLNRREVHPIWSDESDIVIRDGLVEGERLCMTLVPYAVDGMEVTVSGDPETEGNRPMLASAGGFVERMLAALPSDKPLPPDLKARLNGAAGNPEAMRGAMKDVRAWAEEQGVQLPASGR